MTVCTCIRFRSSGVRGPGFNRMLSSMPTFPMSCSAELMLISLTKLEVTTSAYFGWLRTAEAREDE